MFTLRRYQATDQPAIEHLHVSTMISQGTYLGRGPWDDDVYEIEEAYFKDGGEFLIGEWDGQFIAMGAFKRTGPQRAEVKRMRIHPDYQRRGLGAILLLELEARARQLGITLLHLDTGVTMLPARKLYKKHGYGEVRRAILQGSEQDVEVVFYEKNLA